MREVSLEIERIQLTNTCCFGIRNDGLQNFIENFVKNQFLPIVHVDYRTRVADALASKFIHEDTLADIVVLLWKRSRVNFYNPLLFWHLHFDSGQSAFRLKAHPGAVYEKGRPVLQGPMAANHLVTEVCDTAHTPSLIGHSILDIRVKVIFDCVDTAIELNFWSLIKELWC